MKRQQPLLSYFWVYTVKDAHKHDVPLMYLTGRCEREAAQHGTLYMRQGQQHGMRCLTLRDSVVIIMDEMDLNLRLVHAVKKFTYLYDFTDTYYSNCKEKETAWKEIAKELQVSETKCKERWRNIRSSYLRHLNNVLTSEAGGKSKTPYYLADHLHFLQPFIKPKRQKENSSTSNDNSGDGLCDYLSSLDETELMSPEEEAENITETKYTVTSSCSKPLKRERRSESPALANLSKVVAEYASSKEQDYDPDMDFFRSVLPDFRTLWPAKKRRVKIEIMKLIDQACNEQF